MKITIPEVRTDLRGFNCLCSISSSMSKTSMSEIELNFQRCSWFEANLCAPLDVILEHSKKRLNTPKLTSFSPQLEMILRKNRFLTRHGYVDAYDRNKTTIPHRQFQPGENSPFSVYLNTNLSAAKLPNMSIGMRSEFIQKIMELFHNASSHSETKIGIFTCGQFFPSKNRIDFCIADAGIGIRQKLNKELGRDFRADQAIEWALQEGNTTRRGNIPGGLGLKLLREFIGHNCGRIQIVSDQGYWEQQNSGKARAGLLDFPFPGTVVNIEINTLDPKTYCLASEKNSLESSL